jgi:hypothetical protein
MAHLSIVFRKTTLPGACGKVFTEDGKLIPSGPGTDTALARAAAMLAGLRTMPPREEPYATAAQ